MTTTRTETVPAPDVRLYILYVRSGKTMAQIARECGLTLSAVSRIIANKRRPSLETAVELSRSLGQPIQTVIEALGISWGKAKWQLGEETRSEIAA